MGRVKNGRIRLQTDRSPLFILGYMHATKSIFAFHFYCLLFIYPSLFFFFFLFSFSIVSPVIIRRNSMLATLLNWLKIMRLLIYCRTLIDWKPLSATIDESFMLLSLLSLSLSLSLFLSSVRSIQIAEIYRLRISSPLCNFIDSCRHFYAALSLVFNFAAARSATISVRGGFQVQRKMFRRKDGSAHALNKNYCFDAQSTLFRIVNCFSLGFHLTLEYSVRGNFVHTIYSRNFVYYLLLTHLVEVVLYLLFLQTNI